MHDQDEAPVDIKQSAKPTAGSHVLYDSNPFSASWSGIQKLLKLNSSTTVGVAFFNIVLSVLLGIAIIGLLVVTIIYLLRTAYPQFAEAIFAYLSLDFLGSINNTSVFATWIITPIVIILIGTLLQTLQIKLTTESAWQRTIKFSELFKSSIGRVPSFIGLVLLMGLAIILPFIAMVLIGHTALAVLSFVLALVWLSVIVFVGLRLSLATFCIVDRQLGPINAIKQSWAITQGHIIEIIGTACVAMLIALVPSVIFAALDLVLQNVPIVTSILNVLSAIVAIVLSIAATMAMAERYAQLQAVADKKATATALSPLNYLAIVIVVLLMIVSSALTPKVDINKTPSISTPIEPIRILTSGITTRTHRYHLPKPIAAHTFTNTGVIPIQKRAEILQPLVFLDALTRA